MNSQKTAFGTKEWSVASVNCITGCSHNCRYCYARYNATARFRRMPADQWPIMRVRPDDVQKKRKRYPGTVMFPTTHDITPEILEPCLTVLTNLLSVGNSVLVVSKPHSECVAAICEECAVHKEHILFRFTIGADDDRLLSYSEPGAPNYQERLSSLRLAYRKGFRTSVSIEPMLDSPNIFRHVTNLSPYVTDSIWIGKLNNIRSRVRAVTDEDRAAIKRIEDGQTDDRIFEIYNSLKNFPLMRWKDSVKKIVGIETLSEPGRDE
jgi:DNA repair photolyase